MQHSWHLPCIFHIHCTKVTLNNLLVTKSLVNLLAPCQPKGRLQCQGMVLHGQIRCSLLFLVQSSLGFPKRWLHSRSQKLLVSLLLLEFRVMVNTFVEKGPERRREEHGFLQTDSCPTLLKDSKLYWCSWESFAEKDLDNSAASSQVSSGTFFPRGLTTERVCWRPGHPVTAECETASSAGNRAVGLGENRQFPNSLGRGAEQLTEIKLTSDRLGRCRPKRGKEHCFASSFSNSCRINKVSGVLQFQRHRRGRRSSSVDVGFVTQTNGSLTTEREFTLG